MHLFRVDMSNTKESELRNKPSLAQNWLQLSLRCEINFNLGFQNKMYFI